MPEQALPLSMIPESGATAVEYALLVSLIAGAIFGSVALFGPIISDLFARVCPALGC